MGFLHNIFQPGKKVYSKWFAEYRLPDEDLKRLQQCLLEILTVVKRLCDDNGLTLIAGGGTMLGAVRHEGFIPWDDDIDVLISRKDFRKFKEIFRSVQKSGGLSEYHLAIPLDPGYYFKIPKVYKKDTEYSSVAYMGNPEYNMIGIDIFIIENIPKNVVIRTARALIYSFAFYASAFCLDHIFPSSAVLEKCKKSREVRDYYHFRRSVGAFFCLFGGISFYLKLCERFGSYQTETGLSGLPSGGFFMLENYSSRYFEDLVRAEFCGLEVNIPRDYGIYLGRLFGDYMEIPPEEEHEVHMAYRIRV